MEKIILFYFFFLLFFLTYQTPKPDQTELKPNAISRFSVPSLQIGLGAQYVKTEILSSVQKLSWTLTEPNWLHPYYQYNHSIPFLMNAITSLQHCSNRILSTNSLMILPSRRDTLFIIFVSLFLSFFLFSFFFFFFFFFFLFYVGTHCLLISTRKKKSIN